jgi:hypothetical protein
MRSSNCKHNLRWSSGSRNCKSTLKVAALFDPAGTTSCRPVCVQRDVPGMTRAAIPVLVSEGVTALTSGVNGFSAPPGVPKVGQGLLLRV